MADLYIPLNNADLHEGANINGDLIATENDLADLRRFLLDALGNRIQELVFNNGSLVTGQGTQNTVPITDLTGKISTFAKDLHITYTDAIYPLDPVSGFMAPIAIDLSNWLMNGVAVTPADIHTAGFSSLTQMTRYITTAASAEITARVLLQPDLASWILKFDLRFWAPGNLMTMAEATDIYLPVAAAPTYTHTDYPTLAALWADFDTHAGTSDPHSNVFRVDTSYFAMAVKA